MEKLPGWLTFFLSCVDLPATFVCLETFKFSSELSDEDDETLSESLDEEDDVLLDVDESALVSTSFDHF